MTIRLRGEMPINQQGWLQYLSYANTKKNDNKNESDSEVAIKSLNSNYSGLSSGSGSNNPSVGGSFNAIA